MYTAPTPPPRPARPEDSNERKGKGNEAACSVSRSQPRRCDAVSPEPGGIEWNIVCGGSISCRHSNKKPINHRHQIYSACKKFFQNIKRHGNVAQRLERHICAHVVNDAGSNPAVAKRLPESKTTISVVGSP